MTDTTARPVEPLSASELAEIRDTMLVQNWLPMSQIVRLINTLDAAVARADEEGDRVDGLLADRKRLEDILFAERQQRDYLQRKCAALRLALNAVLDRHPEDVHDLPVEAALLISSPGDKGSV